MLYLAMPTTHVTVHSETAVTRIGEFVDTFGLEWYVVPKMDYTSDSDHPDHITINGMSPAQVGSLIQYVAANGLKTEITVES